MQRQYTGTEALQIDIANTYGLDKKEWSERLLWAEFHTSAFEDMIPDADEPLLFTKAVHAYREAQKGNAIGHNMFLDATGQGLQILACLSGCKDTAAKVNLINTGKREDVYTYVVDGMNGNLNEFDWVTRDDTKKPTMTH